MATRPPEPDPTRGIRPSPGLLQHSLCAVVVFLVFLVTSGGMQAAGLEDQFGDQFGKGPVFRGGTGSTGLRRSNATATAEPGEPAHAGEPAAHSLWLTWTPDRTASYSFSTAGSSFDTVLAIYQGSHVDGLLPVVANDDVDLTTLTSRVFFRAHAGETFRVVVDGVAGATGSVVLQILSEAPLMAPWVSTDPAGNPVGSRAFTNQVLLVDFWETTCATCVVELPQMVDLQQALAPRGFSLIGLSVDQQAQWVTDYLRQHTNITYPIFMASKTSLSSLLGGPLAMPTKYLVDQDSKILARYSGGHDPLAETYGFYRSQIDPVLRPPLLPDLRLELGLDGSRQLSWPDFDPSFRLEASGNLADNAWATLSAAVQTNDNRFWVELPADGTSSGHRFFRLIRR